MRAATLGLVLSLALASPASANFGVAGFDSTYLNQDGSPVSQAGSHPFAFSTSFDVATHTDPESGKALVNGSLKDLDVSLPAGLVIDRRATPFCSYADFLRLEGNPLLSACPSSSVVGTLGVRAPGKSSEGGGDLVAAFNLAPPPGAQGRVGFVFLGVPIVVELLTNPNPPYNTVISARNASNIEAIGGIKLTLWGNPASPTHDHLRGRCALNGLSACPVDIPEKTLLTLPRSCSGPLQTTYAADSWQAQGARLPNGEPDPSDPNWITGVAESHDNATPPNPLGLGGCGRLSFNPTITAKPTTLAANSPSGLDFSLDMKDEGITNLDGLAASDIKKAEVTLPEGFTINPSVAEGLEVCSEEDLAKESAFSSPGEGCPDASKIGTVQAQSPVLPEALDGGLYLATPYDNPFNSLVALYVVLKNPTLGIVIKQPLEVISDPVTGQLTTVAEEMPQLPFSHFQLHFREGTRSPLASPPACGGFNAQATLYPWSGSAPLTTSSAFQIIIGPESKPCPSAGLPPFKPGLIAGTLNNAAGHYSPFNLRLSRNDSEQEITHFSIKLPPGVIGKLAGIPYCSDAQIARAKARSGVGGGLTELERPSCPAASQVGHSLIGLGVGAAQAYAPGKLYLAGPYHGSAISLVSITAGLIGPFDLGTVVIREALKIDPETAEVFIDSTGSDPIPHIIKGIPVHLRDIRAYVDRPGFVLNPTSCERTSTASTLLGSGLDFGSEADDRPITISTPFQAADCAALKFEPNLSLKLKGGTKRGDHPAFSATLRMRGQGESNVKRAQVTLPRSEFLEQAHIKTICTRAQFRAQACPTASVYGYASAKTPLLDEPLTGPVFLRSSEHKLPDLVAELSSAKITIDLTGRIDSLNGRIRTTFAATPDAPIQSFTLSMQGAGKGLLVNSTNLCGSTHRAIAQLGAHNGREAHLRPKLQTNCANSKQKAG